MLKFSHQSTSYTFIGGKLGQPLAGTFDDQHWTPPTHRIYRVRIQNDGLYTLFLNDARVESGDCHGVSRKTANEIATAYSNKFFNGS